MIKLQTKDFITALAIQKQLVAVCPDDETLAMFSKFLPAEAAEQKQEQEEWEKQPYDEEDENDDEYGDEMLGTAPIPEPDPADAPPTSEGVEEGQEQKQVEGN